MIDLIGNRTLRDLLDERSARFPDKPFLIYEAKDGGVSEWSYTEFARGVDEVAAGLSHLGLGKGDKITTHLPNSPEFLLLLFAAATIGAVLVPSNVGNQASELEHILSYSDSKALVTELQYLSTADQALEGAPAIKHRIIARGDDPVEGYQWLGDIRRRSTTLPEANIDSDDVIEMLFTSGTTARPKGVLLTHANLLRSGERMSKSLYLDHDERCLTALPLFHVNAQSATLLAALTVGGTCVLLEEFKASQFWAQVRRHRATQISLVAMLARTLLAQPAMATDRDHHVRRIFHAINITDTERANFESRFGVELINGYGLSEAMTVVTLAPAFGPKRWPSIGLPTYDRLVRVVDANGEDVPPGTPGEIIVHGVPGRTLMKGYYKDPEATSNTIRDGWLYTGDNAYVDSAGYLYFFDRKKDVIKRAGENISASEVEAVLIEHPQVAEVAVIGVSDAIRDEAVKAFIVTEAGAEVPVDEIINFCSARMASFKVPSIVEIRPFLPKTSIGKIEKKLLR